MKKLVLHIHQTGLYVAEGESVHTFSGVLMDNCLGLAAGSQVFVAVPPADWVQATALSLLTTHNIVTFVANFITVENGNILKLDGLVSWV